LVFGKSVDLVAIQIPRNTVIWRVLFALLRINETVSINHGAIYLQVVHPWHRIT
jgi:hypothetical protein